jgi:hypothetical protein
MALCFFIFFPMFHVEHAYMRLFYAFLLLVPLLGACEKKADPNPELRDPIYADFKAELAIAEQGIVAEKKTLEGHEQELKDVIPQSGQIKFAQKRIYESRDKITKMEQRKLYFELKIKARLAEARAAYRKAFAKGEEWPDPKEHEEYKVASKLRRDGLIGWNVENRMEQAGIAVKGKGKPAPAPPAGGERGGGEAPPPSGH